MDGWVWVVVVGGGFMEDKQFLYFGFSFHVVNGAGSWMESLTSNPFCVYNMYEYVYIIGTQHKCVFLRMSLL